MAAFNISDDSFTESIPFDLQAKEQGTPKTFKSSLTLYREQVEMMGSLVTTEHSQDETADLIRRLRRIKRRLFLDCVQRSQPSHDQAIIHDEKKPHFVQRDFLLSDPPASPQSTSERSASPVFWPEQHNSIPCTE